jgi:hypothetical protein
VVYATILAIALHNLFNVLLLVSGADYLTVFETDQLHTQAMLFLDGFNYNWDIGMIFFGLHLLVLGYLVFKSGYIPRILGVLVIIASWGYLIPCFCANRARFYFIRANRGHFYSQSLTCARKLVPQSRH